MHVYKIHKKKHAHFLKQNRQDPITGDLIVAGDEIVFCHECKSAFLKDTWEYLGGKHCDSKKTLSSFPQERALNLSTNEKIFGTLPSVIRNIRDNSYEKVGKRVIKSKYWKERKVSFDISLDIIENELRNVDFKQLFWKKADYFLKTWGVLIFFLVWIALSFTVINFMYMLMAALGYLAVWINIHNEAIDVDADAGVKDSHPLLIFHKNCIFVYYHLLEKAYTIDYQDVKQLTFFYGMTIISISTQDGQMVSFGLKTDKKKTEEALANHMFVHIEGILKRVRQTSQHTLIRFEEIPEHLQYRLAYLEKKYKNIWVHNF
ncbi:hypothetical protein [Bernardetia sp.]|uniref:hypothetical protein n=1 Tax=Bernardetia sp. TaxID=1937974 RepID=UPI0025B971EB|nr:hypothetical protein [Bernardetia sp.]